MFDLLTMTRDNVFDTRYKGAMVELSHALEDAAMQAGPGTRLYAGFQLASLYEQEADRYRALVERGVTPVTWHLADVSISAPHPVVELTQDDPWRVGWWVVISGPQVKMALVAEDLDGHSPAEVRRRFRGALSFDPDTVDLLEERLAAVAGLPIERRADPTSADLIRRSELIVIVTARLAHYLDLARQRERREAAMKELLARAIVHDIRGPLQVLTGYTELMQLAPDLPKRWVDALAAMDEAGQRLDSLVSTILDSYKIEQGGMRLTPRRVAVTDLLFRVAAHGRFPGAPAISVEVPDDIPPLWVDVDLVERALGNLIANAVKYGDMSPVTLQARCDGSNQVVLTVADEGRGIPPENLSGVFERFAQVDKSGPRQGSGLGLYFCRLVADIHAGSIVARNRPSGGAQFDFTLPAGPSPVGP